MAKRKVNAVQVGVWLALALALLGSLRHVAWAFSTLEHNNLLWGYVQAVAVDAGLVALALGIQQRRRQRRGTVVLWAGVGVFSAISVYANYLHGVVHMAQIDAGPLAAWRPVLLSACLPLLVVYLSEVAGADATHSAQVQEREDRREARRSSGGQETVSMGNLADANAVRRANRETALTGLLTFYRQYPDAPHSEAAAACGRSRSWVTSTLAELDQAGTVERDNGTVKVLGV